MTKIAIIAMLLHYTPVPVQRICTTYCDPPPIGCTWCGPTCTTYCY